MFFHPSPATVLFFVVSKELYRITMSLRGMVMPDDKNITWKNSLGLAGVLAVSYLSALILHTFSGTGNNERRTFSIFIAAAHR